MTTKDTISALVTRYGIHGVLGLLADYMEDQAIEHKDTVPSSAVDYDDIANRLRKVSIEIGRIVRC